jgi:chromosome segregation ATPase
MKDVIKETLAFSALTPEEKEKRGILGRLYGPCADFINPTRNGRAYSDELWEKVFQQELVQEAFQNGGIFGELDHPADRQEICSEKIAICMPEAPKKDKDGHLIAYFDILDTPCGRIAYQLAKYGYKLGVSSRGTGDVYDDGDGEIVDPDTYDFTCFDLVITPSVKDARLSMTESLQKPQKSLTEALCETLNEATEEEREVMKQTLKELNIDVENKAKNLNERFFVYTDAESMQKAVDTCIEHIGEQAVIEFILAELDGNTVHSIVNSMVDYCQIKEGDFGIYRYESDYDLDESGYNSEKSDNIQQNSKKDLKSGEEAIDDGTEIMIKNLQEAVKEKTKLEEEIKSLQEKLAVSNAKVDELTGEVVRYKESTVRLSSLSKKTKNAPERLQELEEKLNKKQKTIEMLQARNKKLIEGQRKTQINLNESIAKVDADKDKEILSLKENLNVLNETEQKTRELNENLTKENSKLTTQVESLKKKVAAGKSATESYKKLANDIVDKYIDTKATMLGLSVSEIKNKLSESFTLDEIDEVCENLQTYALNISKSRLPFNIVNQKVKAKITESKNEPLRAFTKSNPVLDDDDIDDSLMRMAGLDV